MKRWKYQRTYHLPFSPGRTEDDKTLGDCSIFEGKTVAVTIKMDGENTTGYWDGYIHARSIDGRHHESRDWVKQHLSGRLCDLPEGWRICGENLYAKHSIHYENLSSFFYLFSIWNEKNECLGWRDTLDYAALLDLNVVPFIYQGKWDEKEVMHWYELFLKHNPNTEGFVVRNVESFSYGNFRKNVAKYVRAEHVQSNQHWMKSKVIPNLMSS